MKPFPNHLAIKSTSSITALALLASLLVLVPLARAHDRDRERDREWVIKDLGTLGGESTLARGINNRGQVVGQSARPNDDYARHAFIYEHGRMRDLGLPGNFSLARDVNEVGVVIAYDIIDGEDIHPVLYRDGVFKKLDVYGYGLGINDAGHIVGTIGPLENPKAGLFRRGEVISLGALGGSYSVANAINNAGQIVGGASLAGDVDTHAFVYQGSTMRDLGTLGGSYSFATAINNRGWIVGNSSMQNDAVIYGFVYDGHRMRSLGSLAGNSYAFGINNLGDVVGANEINVALHAVLYKCGEILDLNTLPAVQFGWVLTEAVAINDLGQIVANGVVNGESRGFLLTPPSKREKCHHANGAEDADTGRDAGIES
jgi:probable HAF family extracellular repeat protein